MPSTSCADSGSFASGYDNSPSGLLLIGNSSGKLIKNVFFGQKTSKSYFSAKSKEKSINEKKVNVCVKASAIGNDAYPPDAISAVKRGRPQCYIRVQGVFS
ncbi:hypothetical protein BVRB_005410 [Beta vulgaris subsp. vulgaris]|uniref:Uncharacterized protein n=1 Tax=Beta vulgaris subsp. vulgaris TaxID=3555 RepID=A0A0J8B3L6_BETVV|nr:hypothetical protein BVRB_005410 [Beta vulgaris subsp. vulgaris]